MARVMFEVAYDGEDVSGHSMDVYQLAPALLSLGDLIREANAQLNGDAARVRVLVQSDFEHKCFNINLEAIQSFYEQVKTFLHDDDVGSIQSILDWLGFFAPGGVVAGVFGFLRWRKGRDVSTTEIQDETVKGSVTVRAGDGSPVTINQNVYRLAENPKIQRAIAGVFRPLEEPGIDKIEFRVAADHPSILPVTFNKQDAVAILASCTREAVPDEIEHPSQPILAHLRVHAPVFDAKADRWRFRYGEEIIYADISETTIATDAIARGGVMIDDLYYVQMEITEYETSSHQFRKAYKIIKVLEFTPAPRQPGLFDKAP